MVEASMPLLAADTGTTVAIVIASLTLLGTITGNIVAWYKIKRDSESSDKKIAQERERSNVEIAQTVLTETIARLDERIKEEVSAYEAKLEEMRCKYEQEISDIQGRHERDVRRLERKIETLTNQHRLCQEQNDSLRRQLQEIAEDNQ